MLPVLTIPGSLPEILSVLRPCSASQQYPDHARTTPTAVTTSTTTAITSTRAVLVIRPGHSPEKRMAAGRDRRQSE